MAASQECFLQDCSGATKWIKNGDRSGLLFKWSKGKIEHDLREFWREHANKRITTRALTVSSCIGGDILCATALRDVQLARCTDDEKLYFVCRASQLVVVRGSSGEGWLVIWDETEADARSLEGFFQ